MTADTETVRFNCPSCGQGFETTPERARQMLTCTYCGTQFVPKYQGGVPVAKATLAAKGWTVEAVARTPDGRAPAVDLRKQARTVSVLCFLFFILMGICVIGAVGASSVACAAAAGGFLFLYMMGQLLAQLLYIRAALEELAK